MPVTSFGNKESNIFVITNQSGYAKYNGMGGNDFYNVYPELNESITISDSVGVNSVVLGITEITSSLFFKGGVKLNYASGGSLTVLGNFANNPDLYKFVFGGGENAFAPVNGGTSLSFSELAKVFGVDPTKLSDTPVEGGYGTLNQDGTISGGSSSGDEINMSANGVYTATDGVVDIFIYEFSDYTGGSYGNSPVMVGLDGKVTIIGFNNNEDIIRFVDKDSNPPSKSDFLNNESYIVTIDPLDTPITTTISLSPYYGESGNDAPVVSDIIIQGVTLDKLSIPIEVI